MIEIGVQSGNSKAAFPQGFAVACMLFEHLVIAGNSQVRRGESLGKIPSRNTNNGMRKHYRSICSVNLS